MAASARTVADGGGDRESTGRLAGEAAAWAAGSGCEEIEERPSVGTGVADA
jgi:hypothetical protein